MVLWEWKLFWYSNLHNARSLHVVIGKLFDDSCWWLSFISLTCHVRVWSNHATWLFFWSDQHDFVNYYIIYFSFFLFLSFIAQGLAMCQLGGVITTQKVLFYTFNSLCFKHFCVVVLHFYSNWHVKDLAMTSNHICG